MARILLFKGLLGLDPLSAPALTASGPSVPDLYELGFGGGLSVYLSSVALILVSRGSSPGHAGIWGNKDEEKQINNSRIENLNRLDFIKWSIY